MARQLSTPIFGRVLEGRLNASMRWRHYLREVETSSVSVRDCEFSALHDPYDPALFCNLPFLPSHRETRHSFSPDVWRALSHAPATNGLCVHSAFREDFHGALTPGRCVLAAW